MSTSLCIIAALLVTIWLYCSKPVEEDSEAESMKIWFDKLYKRKEK